MRFLLDTNVFEHVANRAHNWQLIQASIEQVGIENCAISAVTAYELRHHIERGPGRVRQENVVRLTVMFAAVPCVSVTLKIADAAGRIAAYLESIGQAIGPHDPMIAATAMTRGMICVTDNVKHFARGETCASGRSQGAPVWDALADTPEKAANLRLRSELMGKIAALVDENRWTQADAAQLRVTQARMNDLLRGRISRLPLDAQVSTRWATCGSPHAASAQAICSRLRVGA